MIGQEKIQKPIQANPSDGGVTTEGWRDEIGWGACTAIVTTLCEGSTGTVSRTTCLSACAPFISTFWGYGACGAACFVIVDTVNSYGCGIGAAAICDEIM